MEFAAMDSRAYRALDSEAYQERRALVLGLAGEMPEDASEEQIRSIDSELDIIKAEDSRRDSLVNLRNHKAVEIVAGAGSVVDTAAESGHEEVKRGASLGERVVAEMQTRGVTQGERFNLSNIAFRAGEAGSATTTYTPNMNPSLTSDYGKDTLIDVDETIREGYRRPLTIIDLFSSEVTEKDAVSFYVEGAVTGAPAMTAEGGAYAKLNFGVPTKKTNALKKITAMWKNSDELISDSPRLVSHINARAPYLIDIKEEDQVLAGDGTGENITGLLNTSGIATDTISGIDIDLIDALLDYRNTIMKATPNLLVDGLVVSDEDYATLMTLKDKNDQYLLGGPTNIIYGSRVAMTPVLWNSIKVVPSPAMAKGTLVLGAFKRGGSVVKHVTGRRFEMGYDGEDFSHGLVTFRSSERLTLNVEYPGAFVKLSVSTSPSGGGDGGDGGDD